jgi:hypothetical protein
MVARVPKLPYAKLMDVTDSIKGVVIAGPMVGGKRCRFSKECTSIVVPDVGFCKKHMKNIPTQVLVSKYMEQI